MNDPLFFTDPTGTDLWEKLSNWYWGGMGGFSQLVDNVLLGGATEDLGRTVGEYECGTASGWDVVLSGGWLALNLVPAAKPIRGVSIGNKALASQAVKTKGGATPVRLGQQGEKAAGIKGPKTTITVNGKNRIPDKVDDKAKELTEVKNVKSLSYTKQLQDYMAFCKKNKYKFILYTREDTSLSKTLKDLIKNGEIIHKILP